MPAGRLWHAEVEFVSAHPLVDDSEWDLLEQLAHLGNIRSVSLDPHSLALSFSIEARNAASAAACAENAAVCLRDQLGDIRVTGLRVHPQGTTTAYLFENLEMPELVGHEEVMRLCHGHLWFGADDTNKRSFPHPRVTTASGSLWSRDDVLAWIASGPHPN